MRTTRQNSTLAAADETEPHIQSLGDKGSLRLDLQGLGLEESEALMYLGLLHTGPITVGTMAAKLGIDRAKIYRSLAKLRNLGLVTTSFSNPTICTPQEPKDALQIILDKKRDELYTMQKLAEKISLELSELKVGFKKDTMPYFSVIQSRSIIYARIGRMIQESRGGIIYVITTPGDLAKMYHTAIPEKIHKAAKNGTRVRILTEPVSDDKVSSMVRKFGAVELGAVCLPSRGRMIVERDGSVLMSNISGRALDISAEDVSIDTNSSEIVQNVWALCEHLYKVSRKF